LAPVIRTTSLRAMWYFLFVATARWCAMVAEPVLKEFLLYRINPKLENFCRIAPC